jgi:signal transduction histidine kinase
VRNAGLTPNCTDNGRVRIGLARRHGGGARVTEVRVTDTGVGIRPDDQARLFRAFEQVAGAGAREQGTGLGLHLSQKLAHLLGGEIRCHSEYGKGSTFTLVLTETWQGGPHPHRRGLPDRPEVDVLSAGGE